MTSQAGGLGQLSVEGPAKLEAVGKFQWKSHQNTCGQQGTGIETIDIHHTQGTVN